MRAETLLGAGSAVAVTALVAGLGSTGAAASAEVPHAAPQHSAAPNGAPAHGLGANLSHRAPYSHTAVAPIRRATGAALPRDATLPTIDPGDQGKVGSCVAWATGHTGYGVLMNEQNITGGPMAPMFIYAQIAEGNDQGTTGSVALGMEKDQGIDTASDYTQGDVDFTTQPTDAEKKNAAHYTLSGYDTLPTGEALPDKIKQAIAQGEPVAVGFEVHQSFERLTQQTAADYSYLPGDSASDPVVGGHEVTIIGYTDKGVRIENSWGAGWGDGGYFTVSWDFVKTQLEDAIAMGKINYQP